MANESLDKSEVEVQTSSGDRLLTVDEMCTYLGIKVGTLKDWTKLKENPCPCYRYKGRILRFDKSEVMAWFKERTENWR